MPDQKILNPEQIAEVLENFKQQCQLNSSGQQPSIDDNLLEKQLNDPDLQRLLDAEHDQLDVEVFRFLAYRRANTGHISNFINFGKLSNKNLTSAALKNKLRSMRLSQRIQNKKNEIQKRNELMEKDFELIKKLMAQKNTELDEDLKQKKQKISLEIGKIIRNIHSFSEKEKKIKSTMDQDIKKLKVDETRAKADMERKTEEMKKEYMKAEEATKRNILEMNENEVKIKKYYDIKIQKLKDNEAEIRKNIKNKQDMLARKEENFKKSIENWQRYEAEKTTEIDAKLKKMNDIKAQVKENIEKNIQAMQSTVAEGEEKFKRSLENMRQQEDERISELQAKLKEMNKDKAKEEEKIKKNIQAMQNTLKSLEEQFNKNIENMRQQEAEKKKEIEEKRQKIYEMRARNRIENEQAMQMTRAKKKRQTEEKDEQLFQKVGTRECTPNTSKEILWEVRDIKKENIEETVEPQQKRVALSERDAPVNYINVRNTRLLNRMAEEALMTNRSKSRVVHPGGQFAIISERHRWTQRTNSTP